MKTSTKHTPGPWKVCRGDWSEDGNARYELEGISVIGAADARLIAAAPDLLEALEFIDAELTQYLELMPMDETSRKLRDAAREVIAKATE